MIEYQVINGRNCPVILCDGCSATITDPRHAGVVWSRDGEAAPITILCKGNGCLSSPKYRGLPWEELTHFLVYLVDNVGLRGQKWTEARDDVDECPS